MERVLRAVFVDRAERLLSQDRSRARSANDLRIGLMIGVHRNFVREIRTTKPRVQLEKVQRDFRRDFRRHKRRPFSPDLTMSRNS